MIKQKLVLYIHSSFLIWLLFPVFFFFLSFHFLFFVIWFVGDVSVVRGVARTKLLDLYHDDVIG